MHEGISGCDVAQEKAKAFAPQASPGMLGGTGSSAHSNGLRKQLYERQWRLQSDLQEVQDAINILDNDETVNKVLKVFEVAGK